MRNTMNAAALVIGLSFITFAGSAARADDLFSTSARETPSYFHNGRSATPEFTMMAMNPDEYLPGSPLGASEADPFTSRSHGRP